jgi:hypothetical protein
LPLYTVVKKFTSEEEINSQLRDLTAEVRRLRSEFLQRTQKPIRLRERAIGRGESPAPQSRSTRDQ